MTICSWSNKVKKSIKKCVFSTHLSFSLFYLSFSVQLPWKWTINLFPKGIPHATEAWQPQYDGCCVVNKQFSWASLPLKGTFSSGPDHVKNVVVKGFSAFLLTQRCQMERVRISKHVNPRERKLSPFLHSAWEFIQHVGNFLCLSNTSVPFSSDAICPYTERIEDYRVTKMLTIDAYKIYIEKCLFLNAALDFKKTKWHLLCKKGFLYLLLLWNDWWLREHDREELLNKQI